jgi:hypothetical protein
MPHPDLDRLAATIHSLLPDVDIDHRAVLVSSDVTLEGIYVSIPTDPAAATIEVWRGQGGWDVFIDDALRLERGATTADRIAVNNVVIGTILGGHATYRIGRRHHFFAGDHEAASATYASVLGKRPPLLASMRSPLARGVTRELLVEFDDAFRNPEAFEVRARARATPIPTRLPTAY